MASSKTSKLADAKQGKHAKAKKSKAGMAKKSKKAKLAKAKKAKLLKAKKAKLLKAKKAKLLKAKEAETDEEAKKRILIEENMTAALLRYCPNEDCTPKVGILKTDGCNHMTCPKCRTSFCYLCKLSHSYADFYTNACYQRQFKSSEAIHEEDVRIGALKALQLAEEEMPDVELKFDPTIGMNLPK